MHREDRSSHDISDEHIVSSLRTVTENVTWLSTQQTAGEDRHDPGLSIRPLPRTEDVRVPQGHGLESATCMINGQVVLHRELAGAVLRNRSRHTRFGYGELRHVTVR